ncbi:histidinol-phosphate transaminase [Streptomyces sp. NPDC048550]|uniref:histidinol-phosphate transaminase n=1 Tax=unclassified Streptomyces TaxID=2593676 RepID=UPI002E123E78|nr:histidinol-phosphate transaminase [Streptomyces sp. NBC_01296]WSW57626.1 histidinol-phosphate transaminase [Streptomyces sp. NBC_00998]
MGVPIRADLAAIPDYNIPATAPDAVLLNSNEGPLPPPPSVVAAIARAAVEGHRYPQWFSDTLVSRLAADLAVPEPWIGVGCGSVSLCRDLIQAACGPGDEVLCAWRSFDAYPAFARAAGVRVRTVPLDAEHRHDLGAMLDAVTPATRVVFVCNPNNPTGTVVRSRELHDFLERLPDRVLVVLDEAYREFVTDPDVPDGIALSRARRNVAVLRTFSKAYGLAGVRIGYCVAPPAVVSALHKVAVPFAVSRLAQAAALAALDHPAEVRARCAAVVRERDRLHTRLLEAGYPVPPSQANFLWLPVGERATEFADFCARHGVLVRAFPGDGIRVTVGLPEENDAFLCAAAQAFPPNGRRPAASVDIMVAPGRS